MRARARSPARPQIDAINGLGNLLQTRVAIFGSTGSIGTSALDVVARLPERLCAIALSTHGRVDALIDQCARFKPRYAVITGAEPSAEQQRRFAALGVQLFLGLEGLCTVTAMVDVHTVLLAVVGAAGVRVAMTCVSLGKTLALANKESLVVAGQLLMPLARQTGAAILPVDSEHSAIFQCLRAGQRAEVARVILTASGGPFRTSTREAMHAATAADALKHPTWAMGAKVTIDSATMFNKALEIIEAAWLFNLGADAIDVVIHPQSIVHSMVEFVDGNVIAQLSPPDMRLPIQFALTYPDRLGAEAPSPNWYRAGTLDFEPPDLERFPSLRMGYEVVRRRGTLGAVLNAANEVAVAALQDGRIRLGMIYDLVEHTMQAHAFVAEPTLEDLMDADRWARTHANGLLRD